MFYSHILVGISDKKWKEDKWCAEKGIRKEEQKPPEMWVLDLPGPDCVAQANLKLKSPGYSILNAGNKRRALNLSLLIYVERPDSLRELKAFKNKTKKHLGKVESRPGEKTWGCRESTACPLWQGSKVCVAGKRCRNHRGVLCFIKHKQSMTW